MIFNTEPSKLFEYVEKKIAEFQNESEQSKNSLFRYICDKHFTMKASLKKYIFTVHEGKNNSNLRHVSLASLKKEA